MLLGFSRGRAPVRRPGCVSWREMPPGGEVCCKVAPDSGQTARPVSTVIQMAFDALRPGSLAARGWACRQLSEHSSHPSRGPGESLGPEGGRGESQGSQSPGRAACPGRLSPFSRGISLNAGPLGSSSAGSPQPQGRGSTPHPDSRGSGE